MTDLRPLPRDRLERMAEAGRMVLECHRALHKSGTNLIADVLRGHGTFYEMNHYPPGDVFDPDSHSQYYYHAHRGPAEHGHFHTFLREQGMRPGVRPVEQPHESYMDERDDAISHLAAISMDGAGFPIGLFTTNRWVTAENWFAADDVIGMLDDFEMDLTLPSWPLNIWLTGMIRLFTPQIADLLHARDRAVADWQAAHPERNVFEDRDLEVTSELPISVAEQIQAVEAALAGT